MAPLGAGKATKEELDRSWSINDVMRANHILDALAEAERELQARLQKEK